MATFDPHLLAHQEWLGFVRPTGLVVSAHALVRAGAILDPRDVQGHERLRAAVGALESPTLTSFPNFARSVLGWSFSPQGYWGEGASPVPSDLELPLSDAGITLRPDFVVRERSEKETGSPYQLLVRVLPADSDFDHDDETAGRLSLSPHSQLERLLRHTGVRAGLLVSRSALRLISAPRGESSGWIDFLLADMVKIAGRPIASALRLLLSETRLLALPREQRFAALLESSRQFQNSVSEQLAEQVLHALYELVRGFQMAHDLSKGELLRATLADDPDEVYRALLTVILRLVFLLYAEERDMLPGDEVFQRAYSLAGLHTRLRADAALHPDTMDHRFGAWAQLIALFRMVHDGARAPSLSLPPRHGVLFDPDRFPFLEGRRDLGPRQVHERLLPPQVPDGTIFRALEKLLVLDGERLSYRALDVEQIGSVYETMMGFRLETALGRSLAIKAAKAHGAPTTIDLEALLAEPPAGRDALLKKTTDREASATVKKALKAAQSLEDLHAALLPVVDSFATPDLVPRGAMILQPSEERRRSGSHYTPRALTEPIVRTTLAPVLDQLRGSSNRPPTPAQILDLKVCDPAMGSGAFLVETCRQLGDALIESWSVHGGRPPLPPDEDEVTFARRQVARRCLYGVDRNPVAVDLAKVSLWLVTLARDHALTFVDHALRHGDSLVGLSMAQIEAFHWDDSAAVLQAGFDTKIIRERLAQAAKLRAQIREATESTPDAELRDTWDAAQAELHTLRLYGDLAILAFFSSDKPKEREAARKDFAAQIMADTAHRHQSQLDALRTDSPPLAPFHWELEFPEVFDRRTSGFDCFVGNPPFAGKNTVSGGNVPRYPDWLQSLHTESHGNADLVAHFFRRGFNLLRPGGTLGLIATNTISQGDTRGTGLRWICEHGGDIFSAQRRVKWPGLAAVIVSVVQIQRGRFVGQRVLDGRPVPKITAFLFHGGGHVDPKPLLANAGKSFVGSYVLGMGFTFDDTDKDGVATPLAEMRRLIATNPKNQEVIFPYIGGSEVNTNPTHSHHRYVINFGDRSEEECRRRWPELMTIVEAKVKPERDQLGDNPDARRRRNHWWQFGRCTPALESAVAGLERVLGIARVGQHASLMLLPSNTVFSEQLIVFPLPTIAAFCALQSRPHELWARFFGSTLEDRLRYTPSDCFETFPFPEDWTAHPKLEAAGKEYYEFRAALMIKNDEGLTKTYNRFHDPDEVAPEILRLRSLHTAMDEAVLAAYGWSDLPTTCDFFLDYEIDDEESSTKKKPYRFRFPDPVRDELLSRLFALNSLRSQSESPPPKPPRSPRPPSRKKPPPSSDQGTLPGFDLTP